MVLVTGAHGQLGQDVLAVLRRRGIACIGMGRETLDVAEESSVFSCFERLRPHAVIHCAAYTAVDRAQEEPEICRAVNARGTRHIAAACERAGAKLLNVSTDYVFPGTGTAPYEVESPTGPLSAYGRSKLEGEQAARLCGRCFTVRTSWVFGLNGKNFVKTMLRLSQGRESLQVVDDQIGSPTYTADLAPLLCSMLGTERYGTYHATNEGFCSWAQFAKEIFRQAGVETRVVPVPSSCYPAKAARPLNSRLSKRSLDAAGFPRLPPWEEALRRFLQELKGCEGEGRPSP